jgi:hypothetical protein
MPTGNHRRGVDLEGSALQGDLDGSQESVVRSRGAGELPWRGADLTSRNPQFQSLKRSPSFPKGTSDGDNDGYQPGHLNGSPKAGHSNNPILLRHWVLRPGSAGTVLSGVEERARLWTVIVVWMWVRVGAGVLIRRGCMWI